MRRLVRSHAALLFALAFAVACDDAATEPNADLIGTFVLISVNGAPLPVTIMDEEDEVEIVSGQLTFNAGGGCIGSITVREPGTVPTQTLANACTWVRAGATVTIHWVEGSTDTATLQAGRITVTVQDIGGLVLVFER